MPFKFSLPAAATLALAVVVSPAVSAKPFKWSGSSDIQTMDIHSQNSALGNGIHAAVYESLVMFNSRTLRVEPLLPFDANAAKALLADAGYKDGFEVDFACSNNAII